MDKKFFEIDERTSTAVALAPWQGGVAPTGGQVVYAASDKEASDLYRRYKAGERYLRRTIHGDDGHVWKNVIAR